jgi:hypothetical protein
LAFQVDITEEALGDAEEYVRFIRDVKKEPESAERWFRGLVQAIYSLEDLAERCPVIPEQDEFPFEIRHLIYFSHRIIFRVERQANRTASITGPDRTSVKQTFLGHDKSDLCNASFRRQGASAPCVPSDGALLVDPVQESLARR